jgi:tetratricopeptide (TPR) repeat protein
MALRARRHRSREPEVREIVKAQAGIAEQDTPAEATEKLRGCAASALPDEDAGWVESHLLALVGLSGETQLGGNRRNEAFSAWRRLLEGLAEQRPLVVVFEDLHWADESLLEFVDELVEWVADVPLLVLATARLELLERRPDWGGGKLNASTIALRALTDEQTAQLLGNALGSPLLPAETQRALLEQAGGNPLYAEQFADLYVERGSTEELTLPETLQGIIAARLDGLGSEEKTLLQDASVVGKVFWAASLGREDRETTPAFHSLERKGFVRRQRRSSVEGQTELAFAHALVRDVAYGQIPRAERALKHRRVAEWIDSLGRPEDHAEMRAYHWRSALELVRASGGREPEIEWRARLSLRDAGDRALALNSFAVAASHYAEALELWPADDPEHPDLLFRLARALHDGYDEDRQEAALEHARDALLAAGDSDRASEAEILLARMFWDRGQGGLVDEHVARARELAGDTVSPSAARVLTVAARFLAIAGGKAEEARVTAQAALAMNQKLGLEELRAHALATIGMAKNDLGDQSGTADMERAVELALAIDSPVAATTVNNLAVHAVVEGDLARADELYAESARLAERLGDRSSMRFVRTNVAWSGYMRGRWVEAFAEADAFIAECENGSPHTNEVMARLVRGTIREARGDILGAVSDLSQALELARSGASVELVAALCLLAAVHYRADEADSASTLVNEVVPLVRKHGTHGAVTNIAHLVSSEDARKLRAAIEHTPRKVGRAWRAAILRELDGDFVGAADALAKMGSVSLEAEQRFYAGKQLLERGDIQGGEAELAKACAFFESVGTAIPRRGGGAADVASEGFGVGEREAVRYARDVVGVSRSKPGRTSRARPERRQ